MGSRLLSTGPVVAEASERVEQGGPQGGDIVPGVGADLPLADGLRLEQELAVSLFHRHARGLILTEQGDLLFRTAHDVFMQLQAARAKLTDSRERPSGDLKITTPPALGINWLIPRLDEFTALYPDIRISLIVTDEELDLSMREADVAIRTRKPTQPDLIQRKLFSMGFHAYCSPEYVKRHGTPRTLADLDHHLVVHYDPALRASRPTFEHPTADGYAERPMRSAITVNSADAYRAACLAGLGIIQVPRIGVRAALEDGALVELLPELASAPMPVSLLHPHGRAVPKRVRAVLGWLAAVLAPRLG